MGSVTIYLPVSTGLLEVNRHPPHHHWHWQVGLGPWGHRLVVVFAVAKPDDDNDH